MKNKKKKEKREKVRSSERIEVNDATKKGIVEGGYGITLSADKEKLVKLIRGEKKRKKVVFHSHGDPFRTNCTGGKK